MFKKKIRRELTINSWQCFSMFSPWDTLNNLKLKDKLLDQRLQIHFDLKLIKVFSYRQFQENFKKKPIFNQFVSFFWQKLFTYFYWTNFRSERKLQKLLKIPPKQVNIIGCSFTVWNQFPISPIYLKLLFLTSLLYFIETFNRVFINILTNIQLFYFGKFFANNERTSAPKET